MSLADTCIFLNLLAVNNYKMKLFQMIFGSSPENFKGFGTTLTVATTFCTLETVKMTERTQAAKLFRN